MTWIPYVVVTYESGSTLESYDQQGIARHRLTNDQVMNGEFSADSFSTNDHALLMPLPSYTSLRLGFWQKNLGGSEDLYPIVFRTLAASTSKGGVKQASALALYHWNGSSETVVDAVSAANVDMASLHDAIHVGLTIGPTYTTFYVNGIAILTSTKIGHESHVSIGRTNNSIGVAMFDDFYIEYSASAELDEPPPPYRFVPMYPSAIGDSEQWKTTDPIGENSQTVRKTGTATSHRLFADSVGLKDLYYFAPKGVPSFCDVAGVGAHIYCNRDNGGLDLLIKSGGVLDNVPLSSLGATGYRWPGNYALVDPSGAAWDWDKVRDVQLGMERIS